MYNLRESYYKNLFLSCGLYKKSSLLSCNLKTVIFFVVWDSTDIEYKNVSKRRIYELHISRILKELMDIITGCT
jgi:hypothetical protein